ncbi:single-stranded DNA-binding protein [Weissella minor]|uniref:Single-stranded DNA-binding protein n=1 Tax=Weissella minor TaxID=1620 RepID=A0A0R2JJR5_9LACO|nr:single-stranded DNA-binding protein [Weissella minor]
MDLKYTSSGTAVGSFNLAVNRQFTNANGERETDFINCVIWRKSAENLANFTGKGSLIAIEGRIQTRNYENQQGQRIYVTEVVVDNFSLLESRAESEQRKNAVQQNNGGFGDTSQTPNAFGNNAAGNVYNAQSQNTGMPANGPFADGQEVNISDDDLPF